MLSEKSDQRPVGRYAPSPTGALHLGNLRTALAAYAYTRSRGGQFLLRVEDLDAPRVREGAEQQQLEDLRGLGIDWDEEPLRQSERSNLYAEALEKLIAAGWAYPCFCSRKDIQLALSAPHSEDGIIGYPGTCSKLSNDEANERIVDGLQHSYRLRVEDSDFPYSDLFVGELIVNLQRICGDFVIKRGDGLFAYQLACAVDDSRSGVTEVLRGDDLLDSGARQAWVLHCLDLPIPQYLHIPLMLGEDGRRLSKRSGDDDLTAFLNGGYDAAAIRSYLAHTLGQCEVGERVTMDQLTARFDLDRVPREPVTFSKAVLQSFAEKR
ncbi:tRNA glutamyl-Q(34) synthetase GluQRS [bacterium]|nr:tRNA glutamyl-Q(34) synthetase GluQRS [bacterium]